MRKQTRNPVSTVTRFRLAAAARAATPAVVQPMERRVLMSAAVLSNGVLTVTGTAGADNVTFQETAAQQYTLTVNGASQSYAGALTSVLINSGDGNDTVKISTYMTIGGGGEPAVSVNAGAGDDTLDAHWNTPITLDGGDGNDAISGSSYDTLPVAMLGGAGNDTFEFQDDVQPTISGGDGNDTVFIDGVGATRPVSFSGGAGTDTLEVYAINNNSNATSINLDGKADSPIGNVGPSTFGTDVENVTFDVDSSSYGSLSVTGNAADNVIAVTVGVYGATVHGGDGNDSLSVVGGDANAIYGDDGNDTLLGGAGGPGVATLSGGAGTDAVDYSTQTAGVNVHLDGSQLSGTAGQTGNHDGDTFDGTTEVVYGGSGADLLVAAPGGGDALYGNGGNDTLAAESGADALFGGTGDDTFRASDSGSTYLDGGPGTDTATVDPTGDTTVNVENVTKVSPPAVLANGVLAVTGTAGSDYITVSGDVNDGLDAAVVDVNVNGTTQSFLRGQVTSVVVNAGDGNDSIGVQEEYMMHTLPPVTVNGGAGNDTLSTGQGASASLNGGDGNDTFAYSASYNSSPPITVSGGAGTDTVYVQPSSSTYISLDGKPDSNLDGYPADAGSQFDADIENVFVYAFDGGSVTIIGDALDNTFGVTDNQYGPVSLYGGDGNDTFVATSGNFSQAPSSYFGGAGTDTIDYSAQTVGVTVYLDGSKPSGRDDQLQGNATDHFDGTVEQVYGGSGNDLLVAAPGGGDALYGNGGNDTLVAQGGADALFGGAGSDTFNARDGGSTYVDGGADADTATVDAAGDTTVNVETVVKPTPTQLTGTTYGTPGSYANIAADTNRAATDGNLNTFFDAPMATGGNVGIDLGSAKAVSQIKFAPRNGFAGRMVGGLFQYSTSQTFSSGVTTVYTVSAAPANGLTTVTLAAPVTARYWRYIGPANGYCDVAEFQLFGAAAATPTQLTGTTYGTPGSYANIAADTIKAATDGNLNTFFDAPTATGGNVGIDLGSARAVSQIRFAPRSGFASRMVGGLFQFSTSQTFSSGVTTVYTVNAAPANGLTTVTLSAPVTARYWRYIGPANGYCDIAEFQLFG